MGTLLLGKLYISQLKRFYEISGLSQIPVLDLYASCGIGPHFRIMGYHDNGVAVLVQGF